HALFLDRLVPVLADILSAARNAGEGTADVSAYQLIRAIGDICAGAELVEPAYDPRRAIQLLLDGCRPEGQSGSAGPRSWSIPVPTVTGHGLHCEARGREELTDLRGVLNDVQRHAADDDCKKHSVVSMRAGKWPSGHLLGEAAKCLAYAAAAPVDVP